MDAEGNVIYDDQAAIEKTPEEKDEAGLRINTNVKAGGTVISDQP